MPGFEQLIDGDPWQVNDADWPAAGTAADKLAFLLNYAMLAPSILNAQPWRFTLADGRLDLHEDAARRMAVVDPEGRESTISCGAALANLVIAARSFGEDPQVDVLPAAEPGAPLAVLRLGPRRRDAADADKRLREAMKRRRTCRFDFDPAPLDAGVMDALKERARSDGATLTWITTAAQKRAVAELVGEAERVHLSDPEFHREIREWLRQRRDEDHEALRELYERMGPASGHSPQHVPRDDEVILTGADVARTFADPEVACARQRALAEASPALALLATAGDDRRDWLAAGQAMQRLLLEATVAGLSTSYLNPPIELAELRRELAARVGITGMPQVLLRIGRGKAVPPTPRRTVREVLTLSSGAS